MENETDGGMLQDKAPLTETCGNCGTVFEGGYCPKCGQSVRIFERPVVEFLRDMLGDLFAFDTRFWQSLRGMVLRPGTLVVEFVGGRHIRYVPPFRAYVFVSFLFFLLLHQITDRQLEQAPDELVRVNSALDSAAMSMRETGSDSLADAPVMIQVSDDSDAATLDRIRSIARDPSGYVDRLLQYLSWALFLLMPLLGGLLWLFFRRSRPFYVPHFLFAITLHTVLFLLLSLLFSLELLWPDRASSLETALLWLLPIHLYVGARQLYALRPWATIGRLALVSLLYGMAVLAVAVALAIAATGIAVG